MDGHQKRTRLTRDKIEKAAMELFLRFGVQRVTIREIAAQADVSQVSIYNMFGSKDGVVEAMISKVFEHLMAAYHDICEKEATFEEKIEAILHLKLRSVEDGLAKFFMDNCQATELIAAKFKTFVSETRASFVTIIDQGKAEGSVSKSIKNETIMIFIDAIISYFIENEAVRKETFASQDKIKDLFTMLFKAMK